MTWLRREKKPEPPPEPWPPSAVGSAMLLAVAAHYRAEGLDFAASIEQAEVLLTPWWRQDVETTIEEFKAALYAAFGESVTQP